ncbi:hypothetical protein [Ralstonia pseudosolanacearum]
MAALRSLYLASFNILKIDRRMVWRARLAMHVCRMLEAVVDTAHGDSFKTRFVRLSQKAIPRTTPSR